MADFRKWRKCSNNELPGCAGKSGSVGALPMPYRLSVLPLLLAAGACMSIDSEPAQRDPEAVQQLERYLGGKVAGSAQACLPSYRADDMTVVDERTILFRDGARRVWRNDIAGGCSGLGRPGTALVTRRSGGPGLCRGEIAQIVDTATGMTVGSCALGDFVPFEAPPGS